MKNEKVYAMSFAKIYPLLVNKAVKKGRTADEVDQVIQWLTGYDTDGLKAALDAEVSYKVFFAKAPFEVKDENFMAICFCKNGNKLDGYIEYDKAFGI